VQADSAGAANKIASEQPSKSLVSANLKGAEKEKAAWYVAVQVIEGWSGRRESNSQPTAWKAVTQLKIRTTAAMAMHSDKPQLPESSRLRCPTLMEQKE
jgi:hypothetical protein